MLLAAAIVSLLSSYSYLMYWENHRGQEGLHVCSSALLFVTPCRLTSFQRVHNIPLCQQLAGFGGRCIAEDDMFVLWKQFSEVSGQATHLEYKIVPPLC